MGGNHKNRKILYWYLKISAKYIYLCGARLIKPYNYKVTMDKEGRYNY